ncbi:MAG: hypothetical protein ACR2L2_11910 [Acidobacteriota bacterium]
MSPKIEKLGPTVDQPFSIEIQGFEIAASELLLHLEQLPELRILSKFSWPLTDDTWCSFTYKRFRFSIQSPFAFLWLSADGPDVPEGVFEELVDHVRNYKRAPFVRRLFAVCRYFFLPRSAG